MLTDAPQRADSFPELRAAFSRQRRGLMGASVALTLFLAADISLSEVNLLGNRFVLGNASVLRDALLLVYGYYLVRYLQHMRDLRDRGPREAFRDAIGDRLIRLAKRQFEPKFVRQNGPFPAASSIKFSYDSISCLPVPHGFWIVALNGTLTATVPSSAKAVVIKDYQVSMTPTRLDHVMAWFHVALGTRYFSEYGLPLLIGALPIVAAAVQSR